jgi:phage gpG-like protein
VKVVTGKLRDSISLERTENGAQVVATAEYAASEEYLGTPYMRPAAKKLEEGIKKAGNSIKNKIEKNG